METRMNDSLPGAVRSWKGKFFIGKSATRAATGC
jgi:hypothetical protein